MKTEGGAQRLRVYIDENDQWHNKPLYAALVERCRTAGIAGATVVRGIEGYGAHGRVHTARILQLGEALPIVVEIIDAAERVQSFLPILDEMLAEGLVTVEEVRSVVYRTGDGAGRMVESAR